VRLLQRRCDEEDYPLLLGMGPGTRESLGVPGPPAPAGGARRYDLDVPEPRNVARGAAVLHRARARAALPAREFALGFHPRLRSAALPCLGGPETVCKTGPSRCHVTAVAMQLPPSLRRVEWSVRVAALGVAVEGAMTVPELRIGAVRAAVLEGLVLDQHLLGGDADGWAVQTGTQGLYKCHAGARERVVGLTPPPPPLVLIGHAASLTPY